MSVCSNFKNITFLKKGKFSEKIPHIIEAILNADKDKLVQKIYVFGSYAYGKPNEKSDVDLLVIIDNISGTSRFYGKLYLEISRLVNNNYDAFDLLLQTSEAFELGIIKSPLGLQSIVQKKGLMIYER